MRRLLIVDPTLAAKSPTMRGWLSVASKILPQRFDEVEVWCFDCELMEPWLKWTKINPVSTRGAIQSMFYQREVRRKISQLSHIYLAETLIQSTGAYLPRADIRFIQFWNTAFMEAAANRPQFLKFSLRERLFTPSVIRDEAEALKAGNTGEWWCVSRGIAAPILRDSEQAPVIRYIPNTYDPARFNHSVRLLWYEKMRREYGFAPEEVVLGFSAMGHFERKGLRQAVQVVEALRRLGHPVSLLVLGGGAATIKKFRHEMKHLKVGLEGVHFAGMVTEIEKHISAADAFFMPSHFEAFSLAEIEAAALGLRLYLTAHPGHEMILREDINGKLLPWDPQGMTAILDREVREGIIRHKHHEMGEALVEETYATAMASHYDAAIARKWA